MVHFNRNWILVPVKLNWNKHKEYPVLTGIPVWFKPEQNKEIQNLTGDWIQKYHLVAVVVVVCSLGTFISSAQTTSNPAITR